MSEDSSNVIFIVKLGFFLLYSNIYQRVDV